MEEETENKKVKGRPKKKGRYGLLGLPHLLSTAVWLLLIVAIGLSAGRMIWMCATDVLAFGREPVTATVVIEEADSIDTIANKLKNAGLIEYTGLFKLYAKFSSAMEDIRPGTYTFNGNSEDAELIVYDYMALVSVMSPSSGLTVVEDLRIPEGATCAQIFQLLEDKGVCTVQELEEFVKGIDPTNPDAPSILKDYWFLDGVQWGDRYSLEGYLFPNTYDFYENDDPKRVIEKMLDGFNASFTEVMRDKLQKLEGYNIRDVVIIASMIEKETASETESFKISSVIYNRLNSKDPQYDYLNIDATIVYALGGKSELTSADLAIDHPYNTYKYKGLPPGAISNPSQNSLAAALDPEDTVDENGKSVKYYFYALDPETEEHHFSKTLEEHEAFLKSLKEGQ